MHDHIQRSSWTGTKIVIKIHEESDINQPTVVIKLSEIWV